MNKLLLSILCPTLVLMSGVAGCTKKEKSFDVYSPEPPRVIRGTESMSMKGWDDSGHRDLDLNDSFDVSASKAARVTINTTCEYGIETRSLSTSYTSPTSIRVFQIIPEILLNNDFSKIGLRCQYEFVLENGLGSKHIFHIQQSPIIDSNLGEVELDRHEQIRYSNTGMVKAGIICSHLSIEPVYFNQMLPLDAFNFEDYSIRSDYNRETVFENALQECRVAIFENDRIAHISKKFKHLFESPGMVLVPTYQINTDLKYQSLDFESDYNTLQKRLPRQLQSYDLANPANAVRRIKIRKFLFNTNFDLVGFVDRVGTSDTGKTVGWKVNHMQMGAIYISPNSANGVDITEASDHWLLTYKGGGVASIWIRSHALWANCDHIGNVKAMLISPAEDIYVEEVNLSGETLRKISFPFEGRGLLQLDRNVMGMPAGAEETSLPCRSLR